MGKRITSKSINGWICEQLDSWIVERVVSLPKIQVTEATLHTMLKKILEKNINEPYNSVLIQRCSQRYFEADFAHLSALQP